MVRLILRAGAWQSVAGVTILAFGVGACGATFQDAASTMLPICFSLLAAAAAFTLDEPASQVVDVTPTGPGRRTGFRAVALLAPLATGLLVLTLAAARGQEMAWAATGLALVGNVALGFSAACVARTRTGEPGPTAAAVVALALTISGLVPQISRWVCTFPALGTGTQSSNVFWCSVLAVCLGAVTVSLRGQVG